MERPEADDVHQQPTPAARLPLPPEPDHKPDNDQYRRSSIDGGMWQMEAGDRGDCDCLGPPPEFLLPPPPRPPLLQPEFYCTDDPLPDIEACDAEPTIDASYHSNPNFQTSAVIALCSILLVLGVFIGALLVWKHKRKVANLFPCKSTAGARAPPPPAALYEDLADLADLAHRPPDSQLEMLDVKLGTHFPSGYPVSRSPPMFLRSSPGPEPYRPRDHHDHHHHHHHDHEPVYEELPAPPPGDSADSDGDFAGDELSLAGELPPAPCISTIHRERRSATAAATAARRHHHHNHSHNQQAAQFHEGLLLDALLRLYPSVGTVGHAARAPAWPACGNGQRRAPATYASCYGACPPHVNNHSGATACSRDSLGSDSGYSNTTRASSRNRRDLNNFS